MDGLALLLTSFVTANCPDVRATVNELGVIEQGLPDADWRLAGDPCRERPWLRLIGEKDGRIVRSVSIRPELELVRRGLVATQAAGTGELVRTEEAWVPHDLPPVRAGTLRALRPLVAGQPLGAFDAEPIPDAARGTVVTLVVTRGALTLKTEGRLLADATLDAEARAVNPGTGAVLKGILTDPTTVEIR